jgi:prepilin-type processing-associated H-X9-DG protein
MIFDGRPWHFVTHAVTGEWWTLNGFTNVVYCDGHTKMMQNRTLLYTLGINPTP